MPLRVLNRSFRPRVWAFALAVAASAAGVALGNWQSGRAEEKRSLAARLETGLAGPARELPAGQIVASEFAMTRVAARGEFLPQHTVLLDNRIRQGRPGFEVITPLRLAHSELHVVVNRGWIEAPAPRSSIPHVRTPTGMQRIEGLALEHLPRAYEPSGYEVRGSVLQNLRLEEYRATTGLALLPIVIEQRSAADDDLTRVWPRLDAGVEKHEMYALQWYSLAMLAVVLFLVLSFRHDEPASR